jgi:hypothetical protein
VGLCYNRNGLVELLNERIVMKTYELHAADIFSKWGFDDGDFVFDIPEEYPYNAYKLKPEFEKYGFAHALLIVLVETHVLPTIPTSTYTNYCRMMTMHNPVRAEEVAGVDVNNIVTITQDDVNAAIESILELNRTPSFETAEEAIVFLYNRLSYAGVSDSVAKLYAQDLKKIIDKENSRVTK